MLTLIRRIVAVLITLMTAATTSSPNCECPPLFYCASNGINTTCLPCTKLCLPIKDTNRFSDLCHVLCDEYVKIYAGITLESDGAADTEISPQMPYFSMDFLVALTAVIAFLVIWEQLSSYRYRVSAKYTVKMLSAAKREYSERSRSRRFRSKCDQSLSTNKFKAKKRHMSVLNYSSFDDLSTSTSEPTAPKKWNTSEKPAAKSLGKGDKTGVPRECTESINRVQGNLGKLLLNRNFGNKESTYVKKLHPSHTPEQTFERCSVQCCKTPTLSLTSNLDNIFTDIVENSKGITPDGIINMQFCKPTQNIVFTIKKGSEATVTKFIQQFVCRCFYKNYISMRVGDAEKLLAYDDCGRDHCSSIIGQPTSIRPSTWIVPGSPLVVLPIQMWDAVKKSENIHSFDDIHSKLRAMGKMHDGFSALFSVGGHMIFQDKETNEKKDAIVTCWHAFEEVIRITKDIVTEEGDYRWVFLSNIYDADLEQSRILEVGTEYIQFEESDTLLIFANEEAVPYLTNKIKPKCEEEYRLCNTNLIIYVNKLSHFVDQLVTKNGCSTGHTYGKVIDTSLTRIAFADNKAIKEENTLFFVQPTACSRCAFASGGDSGSLIVQALLDPTNVYTYGMVCSRVSFLYDASGIIIYDAVKCRRLSYSMQCLQEKCFAAIYFPGNYTFELKYPCQEQNGAGRSENSYDPDFVSDADAETSPSSLLQNTETEERFGSESEKEKENAYSLLSDNVGSSTPYQPSLKLSEADFEEILLVEHTVMTKTGKTWEGRGIIPTSDNET